MKKILIIKMMVLSILGCKNVVTEKSAIQEPAITELSLFKRSDVIQKFEQSTYDRTDLKDRMINHQSALASLSEYGIFKAISTRILKELSRQDQNYLSKHPEYELLSVAKGALTSAAKNDRVFIVFDKSLSNITILIYQAEKDLYRKLYRTVKVENGLEDAGCNYGAFGTLDYQMGDEIIHQQEFLKKNVGQFFITVPIILNGVNEDENFIPDYGCFSTGMNTERKVRFLAIPTSQIYNNWECLTYDSASDSFLIFYGQAFAD